MSAENGRSSAGVVVALLFAGGVTTLAWVNRPDQETATSNEAGLSGPSVAIEDQPDQDVTDQPESAQVQTAQTETEEPLQETDLAADEAPSDSLADVPAEEDAAQAEVVAEAEDVVETEDAAQAEAVAEAEVVAAPTVTAPSLDTFRVESDGQAVLAGRADPGAVLDVVVGGQVIDQITADNRGSFFTFLDLEPSDQSRSLTLIADPNGDAVSMAQTYFIEPFGGEPDASDVAQAPVIPGAIAPAETEQDTPEQQIAATEPDSEDTAPIADVKEVDIAEADTDLPAAQVEEVPGTAATDDALADAQNDPAPSLTAEDAVETAQSVQADVETEALPAVDTAQALDVADSAEQPDETEPAEGAVAQADLSSSEQEQLAPATESAAASESPTDLAQPARDTDQPAVPETPVADQLLADVEEVAPDAAAPEAVVEEEAPEAVAEEVTPEPAVDEQPQEVEIASNDQLADQTASEANEDTAFADEESVIVSEAIEEIFGDADTGSETEEIAIAEETTKPDATEADTPTVLVADEDGVRVVSAGPGPQTLSQVALDTITYDPEGEVLLAGRASSGGFVQVYIDNKPITTSRVTTDRNWRTDLPDIDTGIYTLRIDEVDADGTVVSRIETPFKREEPETVVAAMAEQTSQDDFDVAVKTVQPGATLWAIAREQYGEGILYVAVYEANQDQIRDPDLIYPGQIFVLPELEDGSGDGG